MSAPRQVLKTGIILSLLLLIGCAPSARYGGADDGTDHYYVSSKWDYRTNYHIPEDRLRKIINSYIGVRYKDGGMSRNGFDCSGFVAVVFRELNRARLPRSTGKLKSLGKQVSPDDARVGDLVFFRGGVFGMINHVGIYLGNRTFAHSSSTRGVSYDKLDDDYYLEHFAMIRRIF